MMTLPFLRVFFPSGADLVTDGVVVAVVCALTAPVLKPNSLYINHKNQKTISNSKLENGVFLMIT